MKLCWDINHCPWSTKQKGKNVSYPSGHCLPRWFEAMGGSVHVFAVSFFGDNKLVRKKETCELGCRMPCDLLIIDLTRSLWKSWKKFGTV